MLNTRKFSLKIERYFQKNSTKIYLIVANVILVSFGIWFNNVGVLPFKNITDFILFLLLAFTFALYRPGWSFLLTSGFIVLENVNIAPDAFSISLRPYQIMAFLTLLSLILRKVTNRMNFDLPKLGKVDIAVIVFVLASFVSSLFAISKTTSLKQSVILLSFAMIYALARIFIQDAKDFSKVIPFILSSSFVISFYAILQNIRFQQGLNSFEIMPGRSNATFTEPDWLGIYIVFVIAVIFALLYKTLIIKNQETITKKISNYKSFGNWFFGDRLFFVSWCLFLVILYVVLILTVARSAWLGASGALFVFVILDLINGGLNPAKWQWKKASKLFFAIFVSLAASIAIVYVFRLTDFQLFNRVQSTASGMQEITISCKNIPASSLSVPIEKPLEINNTDELEKYNCKHINLEDIDKEVSLGNFITIAYRKDPNVEIRGQIYKKSLQQVKENPVFGIGWGNISKILGNDERGAGLNSSNIFLEIWLGGGIIALLSFVFIVGFILIKSIVNYYKTKNWEFLFVILGITVVLIPNMFNAGIMLGFVWIYLAVATSLIDIKQKSS